MTADWSEPGYPDYDPPKMPEGLWLTMRYDVTTPMRPADYLTERAMRWTQAEHDQRAYRDAIADVQAEAGVERGQAARTQAEFQRERR